MKYKKGDLVAISTLDGKRVTGVITTTMSNGQFLHCYIIEDNKHKLIYEREVEFLIVENFKMPDDNDEDVFDIDYSFYRACEKYYYYNSYSKCFEKDSEDDEND